MTFKQCVLKNLSTSYSLQVFICGFKGGFSHKITGWASLFPQDLVHVLVLLADLESRPGRLVVNVVQQVILLLQLGVESLSQTLQPRQAVGDLVQVAVEGGVDLVSRGGVAGWAAAATLHPSLNPQAWVLGLVFSACSNNSYLGCLTGLLAIFLKI